MVNHFISKQFFTFLITGGITVTVNFFSRIIYNHSFDFSTSIVFAYMTSMFVGFTLGRLFVFKTSQQTFLRSTVLFVIVNLIGLVQAWLISMAMLYYILPPMHIKEYNHEIAYAFGLMLPVFTTFLGHKYWTYRSS